MRYLALLSLLVVSTASSTETLIHNIAGYTSTASGIRSFSVLVIAGDGKIAASGGPELLQQYPDALQIDGDGRCLLPGLTDAHAHVYQLGFLAVSLDLAGTPSLQDALAQVASYAAQHARDAWILGRGWNQVLWPQQQFPLAADLDAVLADRPVWLRRIDGHAAWANSTTLRLAGIDDSTPDPVGGRILRDSTGKASGVLIDRAMDLVTSHIPAPGKAAIRDAYVAAMAELLPLGMTGVHDTGVSIEEAEVYMSLADDAALPMRVYAMLSGAGGNLDALHEPLLGYGNDHLDIRAVKLYVDGALGSRGAALLAPYADDAENRGLLMLQGSELINAVAKANGMGFQVAIHAIGDRGNRVALDAFAEVQQNQPSPLRNRIEHAQIIALEDIPRFAALGVIASMQPTHATSDMNMAEARIGAERIKGGYAWQQLLRSGAVIAAGSDFPVELPSPFYGLYAAVTRQDRNGQPPGGWYGQDAMSREQALHAFTLASAFAAHQEQRLGSLEPGKWADFILVDRDYFRIPADQIDDIQVLETWIGGSRVYQRTAQ